MRGNVPWVLGGLIFMLASVVVLAGCVAVSERPRQRAAAPQSRSAPRDTGRVPVRLEAVVVTPHVYSEELRYRRDPDPSLGALVRLVVVHDGTVSEPARFELAFNGYTPAELEESGEWSWYEMPGNKAPGDGPYQLGAGHVDVFTFNGHDARWGAGTGFDLTFRDTATGAARTQRVTLDPSTLALEYAAFLADREDALRADSVVAHVSNAGSAPARLAALRLYAPADAGGMGPIVDQPVTGAFTEDGTVPPGDWSGFEMATPELPLVRGLVEVALEQGDGELSLWAPLMFKRERFDIGAGWLDAATSAGVVPVTSEPYLKLLTRMHVNLAHIEQVHGYTDSTGPDGLYTRYPLRGMSYFHDVSLYDSDEWVARIHGVDALGEPQHSRTSPQDSWETLNHYADAPYPTTVTLSEDKGFRYYAGLSDYPHFDAYRVSAPAADYWRAYDRWDGEALRWGSPLEGIGEMVRTLRTLSRPMPIAAWSQNVHMGWQGQRDRIRKSPNPDEILIQAYQALANGITSLYWYSLEQESTVKYHDTLDMTTRIGREIRALDDLYLRGVAYGHRRVDAAGRPSLDLNTIVTPRAALLFAIDLEYVPDMEATEFRFKGPRPLAARFSLPEYLRNPEDLFRIDADGVHDAQWQPAARGVALTGTLDRVAVHVVSRDPALRDTLAARLEDLRALEAAVGFDPAGNRDDLETLARSLGFDSLKDVEPVP